MKNLIKKILWADDRAHHHTALVLSGLFLSGFMAFWQLFMPQMETHAADLDCSTATNIGVPISECQALLDLYTDTNGPSWTDNTNWDTDTDVCTWFGISCVQDGSGNNRVSSIALNNNNLDGIVPQTIGNLPYLNNIYFPQNTNLTFNIDIVQDLTGLQWLSAYNTKVQGDFDTLSGLTDIREISISCRDTFSACDVTGNLDAVTNMPYIYSLSVDGLGLDGTLDPIYDKYFLQNLDLDNNNITGSIDPAFGNLTGLVDIEMNNNELSGPIPSEIGNLVNATELSLSNNQLSDLVPAEIGNLTNLLNLNLYENEFTGTLPAELWQLTQLTSLDIAVNNFNGLIPAEIGNLTNLLDLNLQENQFTGTLPAELWQLTQLKSLNIAGNNFYGELPDLNGFYQIHTLYLGGNNWVGTLPSAWGDLTTLSTINVGGKSLSASYLHGNLPSSWGNLSNMQRLDIQFTSITGSLPVSWGNWTNLGRFTLFYNDLTGPIPDSYSGFLLNNTMERFWLNNNHLDGDLPEWFGDITSYGKIEANCLDTEHLSTGTQSNLDTYFTNWDVQSNCLPDVRLSTRIVGNIIPGDIIDYYIDYSNVGLQRAAKLLVSQDFADGLIIVTDYSNGSNGLISADYFVSDDICYTDMLHNGEGPYADYLANVLIGYDNMPQGTGTLTEVADWIFRDGGDFGGIDLQFMRDMIGDQQLGSGGMVMTFFCAFVAGILDDGDPTQEVMQDFYSDLGAQCLVPFFAIDPRDIATEECGTNKLYGYNWDIDNLPAGSSGTIHLKIQVPFNATAGTTFQNAAYLQMDGENQSEQGNEQTFSFVVTSANNNGGNNGGGGGGSSGPISKTDEAAGICEVRDCSDSSYDKVCGVCSAEQIVESVVEQQEHASAPASLIPDAATLAAYIQAIGDDIQGTTEQITAFLFAKAAGLTTMTDFTTVRPFDGITRAEFSKLLVAFLENVLGRKADGSRLKMCSQYADVDASLGDLQLTIYKSCMHKVMGLQNNGIDPLSSFNPHEVMTRKYVVTTLSRVIWGNKYDNGDPFYVKHMEAMQKAGLITLPDPNITEQRINAFTVMMRMAEQFDTLFK